MKYTVTALVPCGHLSIYHKKLRHHLEKVRKTNPSFYPEATWDFVETEGIERPKVESFQSADSPSANSEGEADILGIAFQRALSGAWSNALKQDDTPPLEA